MGIFEQFPYSNFHNANLDNVLNNSNQALRDAANAVHIAGEAKDIAEGLADDVATALQEAESASTAAASAEATAAQAQAEAEAASGLAQDAYDLASSADSAAANALSVANTANSNAGTALSTANTANTNASNAVTTANAARTTANTANTNASNAVSTANAASTAASNAVTTANAANTNASNAVATANTANTTANSALDAVNNIPDASATERGLVSTGDQTFAGKKTFTSSPKVSTSGSYADVTLSVSSDSASVEYHGYKANYGGRAYINQTSGKSDGTGKTGYYERYFFPISDANRTSNADYDILTTKTIYTKSDTSSISGVQLRRWGNIVTIFLRGARVNSSGSIGTIPANYRPSAYLYANCVHTAAGGVVRPAQITIESSGTTVISAYNGSNNYGTATNGYVNGTITFVVN